jgi:general secretion pathway protein A
MFLDFYGLREQPFGATPDPHFLFLSSTHQEALASLVCGVQLRRGFVALIARPGMGKTSLLRVLLENIRDSARTAFLFHTDLRAQAFLCHFLSDIGVDPTESNVERIHDIVSEILLKEHEQGRQFVLVIDEAQNLSEKCMESIRLLSNFETGRSKLMQIILAGQPRLAEKLSRPSLVQLRQRITTVIRLQPFSPSETVQYIEYRLRAAGRSGPPMFTPGALGMIAVAAQGIPRNINNICFGALLIGFATRATRIDTKIVREAISDLELDVGQCNQSERAVSDLKSRVEPVTRHDSTRRQGALAVILSLFLCLALWFASPLTIRTALLNKVRTLGSFGKLLNEARTSFAPLPAMNAMRDLPLPEGTATAGKAPPADGLRNSRPPQSPDQKAEPH